MAGYIGLDPDPLTLRELVFMVEGKQRQEWEQTAGIISMIQNTVAKKGKAQNADFFNPTIPKEKKAPAPGRYKTTDFSVLKNHFPNFVGNERVKGT